jgi:hypothetical protein
MKHLIKNPKACLPALLLTACATVPPGPYELSEIPATDRYCLAAQRVVTHTTVPMELVVHDDYAAFVKSKALIEGPTIQQYNWYDRDGNIQGISCKMKNTDHLNLEFGEGAAGPDGFCQNMNQQVYRLVLQETDKPVFETVAFDLNEQTDIEQQRNQTGPEWLMPFTLTYLDEVGDLHVATKGFIIDFADPRYQRFPDSWRGTHYCHLIAPEYLAELLRGEAEADAVVGRKAR